MEIFLKSVLYSTFLKALHPIINRENKNLKKSIVLSGKSCLLDNKKKYETFNSINDAELKIFSQNNAFFVIDNYQNLLEV